MCQAADPPVEREHDQEGEEIPRGAAQWRYQDRAQRQGGGRGGDAAGAGGGPEASAV